MRLFPDDPDRLTLGRWAWCPEGADDLPFATAFCSSKFDPNDWLLQGVGEVVGIAGYSSGKASPRYTGRHFCGGIELWQQGSPLDLIGTPAVDAEGVPLCCDAGPALGGIGVGGVGAAADWTAAELWVRPEELVNWPLGVSLNTWHGVPFTPRNGGTWGISAPVVQDTATGLRCLQMQDFPGGTTGYLPAPALPVLGDFTAYAVGRPNAGPALKGPGIIHGFAGDEPYLWVVSDGMHASWRDQGFDLSDGVPPALGRLELYSWRRAGTGWQLWRNGVQVVAAVGPSAGFTLGMLTQGIDLTGLGGCLCFEYVLFGRALSAAEDAAIWSYLAGKYQESDVIPPGTLFAFAGPAVPAGYLVCDGSAVSRTTYADLFAALGTTWGAGDGSTTFGLPDLRDRVPVGTSPGGLGTGRPTARVLGAGGGEESHVLTQAELPNVNFGVVDPGHQHGTQSGANFDGENGNTGGTSAGNPGGDSGANETNSSTTGIGVQSGGADTPHNTMQPFAVAQWIVKT